MSSKNLGQVAGIHIGNTPPSNVVLIWYDDTPSQKCHKVYDPNLSQWTVLNVSNISAITYSELVSLATNVGLSVGAYFKITDKSNILAIAITSTKVQYTDTLGNILIDDLGTNIQYHVTSSNLLIDDLNGVFDEQNKKLVFVFSDESSPTLTDYFFGKVFRNNVWKLAKFKFSTLLSTQTDNALSWTSSGLFFNFKSTIESILNINGGIVGFDEFQTSQQSINEAINNVSQQNQEIIENTTTAIENATVNTAIYNKTLPSAPTSGTPTDIGVGDSLSVIVTKVQRWINSFKFATGVRISSSFTQANSQQWINNNDTVETAFGKVQYWFKNISLKLSAQFQPYAYTGNIADLAPEDVFEECFKKVQGKLNQIGNLTNGQIQSKAVVVDTSVPVTTLSLKDGNMIMVSPTNINQKCEINSSSGSISVKGGNGLEVSEITKDGILANVARKSIYSPSTGIVHGVSVAGLGFGSIAKDQFSDSSFIAGVAGIASNSSPDPAPAFGGYFDKLKINGMYYSVKAISSTYNVLSTDVFLTCYNINSAITITLPTAPYKGQTVYMTQMNVWGLNIVGSATYLIFYAGNTAGVTSISTGSGERGQTFRFTFDGTYWILNRLAW